MYRTHQEQVSVLHAIVRAIMNAGTTLGHVLSELFVWKLRRAARPEFSYLEFKESALSYKLQGKGPQEYAPAQHTHDYYLKEETVSAARKVQIDGEFYTPDEIARAYHTHPELKKRSEFQVVARALNGVPTEDFALAIHDHDELYWKKDDTVELAYEIGGYKASDFALKDHTHVDQYYWRNEVVDDAKVLLTNGKEYTDLSFAPEDHTHDDRYYTYDEFIKTFLLKNEPYWVSDRVKVDVYDVVPDMSTLDPNEWAANYEILQSPFAQFGMRPQARVRGTKTFRGTKTARFVVVRDIGVAAGRYVSYTLSLPGNSTPTILGVLASVKVPSGTSAAPVQMPIIGGWSGNTIYIGALPVFEGGEGVLVDLLVVVEA